MKKFKIGSVLRSYDFGKKDSECYVEGILEGYEFIEGCERYVIRTTKRVWGNEHDLMPAAEIIYPPVNGTPKAFGGICDFVEEVSAQDKEIDELLNLVESSSSDPNVLAECRDYKVVKTSDEMYPAIVITPTGRELKFTDKESALDFFMEITAEACTLDKKIS